MCAFLRKTNTTSVFISMMRMIFIFGFAKKKLQAKKLRPIKDASMPSRSDVYPEHIMKYKGITNESYTHKTLSLYNSFALPSMIWMHLCSGGHGCNFDWT